VIVLRAEAAANHTGESKQAYSDKAHSSGFGHDGRGIARGGATTSAIENAQVESQASDLVNIRIQNGEVKGCGERLAAIPCGLKKEVEGKTSNCAVLFELGGHSAEAKIGQGTIR